MDYFTEGLQFSYSYYILVLSRFSAFELIGAQGFQDKLYLGNLDSLRDWGLQIFSI